MGEAATEEAAVEDAPAEETVVEESSTEETTAAEAVTEETEEMEVEDDGPLEDWTVKELKDECKTLGLSDKGKKAELIARIKQHRFSAVAEEPTVEDVPTT